jgi:hypothetical protein
MPHEMLAPLVEFDISENTFRTMAKQEPKEQEPKEQRATPRHTSTAVYQLGMVEGSARYHFLAAMPPQIRMPPHAAEPRRQSLTRIIRAALRRVVGGWKS